MASKYLSIVVDTIYEKVNKTCWWRFNFTVFHIFNGHTWYKTCIIMHFKNKTWNDKKWKRSCGRITSHNVNRTVISDGELASGWHGPPFRFNFAHLLFFLRVLQNVENKLHLSHSSVPRSLKHSWLCLNAQPPALQPATTVVCTFHLSLSFPITAHYS